MNSFGLPLTKRYYLEDENDYKKKKLTLLRNWNFWKFIQKVPKRSRA